MIEKVRSVVVNNEMQIIITPELFSAMNANPVSDPRLKILSGIYRIFIYPEVHKGG